MDREKAVKRCQNCEHCKLFKDKKNVQYLSCELAGNKWICEIERCPNFVYDLVDFFLSVNPYDYLE